VIAVRNVLEDNLAWALIEVAKPHLNVLDHNYFFVMVGSGDTFATIHHLLKLIAAKQILLRIDLAQLCATWLDTYAFHDEEQYLRRLLEGFLMPCAIRASAAAQTSRRLRASKCVETLRVSAGMHRSVTVLPGPFVEDPAALFEQGQGEVHRGTGY
jgi:hypothetical protein